MWPIKRQAPQRLLLFKYLVIPLKQFARFLIKSNVRKQKLILWQCIKVAFCYFQLRRQWWFIQDWRGSNPKPWHQRRSLRCRRCSPLVRRQGTSLPNDVQSWQERLQNDHQETIVIHRRQWNAILSISSNIFR